MSIHNMSSLIKNSHYPEVLSTLSSAVSQETHAGTLDNICGALARMIFTNMNGVPLEQVCLP